MFKRFADALKVTDPDAAAREVVKDAHLLAGELRKDVMLKRDGIEVTVHFESGSKSLTGVRAPERK